MFRHRLAPEADYYRLPEPSAASAPATGFALCTNAMFPTCSVEEWEVAQQMYALAMERVLVALRPTIFDRDLFPYWN